MTSKLSLNLRFTKCSMIHVKFGLSYTISYISWFNISRRFSLIYLCISVVKCNIPLEIYVS